MEFRLVNDEVIEFEEFEAKKENLIKVRLHDCDTDVEGIWAVVSDETKRDIDNNVETRGPKHVASLRNSALMFYPEQSWGWIIPIRLCGNNRAECDINWIKEGEDVLTNTTTWEETEQSS